MHDDRNTGTSEFRAVALEALQLGSRLARATRSWIDERRREPGAAPRGPDARGAGQHAGSDTVGSRHGPADRDRSRPETAAEASGRARTDGGYGSGEFEGMHGYGDSTYGHQGGLAGGSASGRPGGAGGAPLPGRDHAEPLHRGAGGHRGKGPRGFKRSDERVRDDLCERLADDDAIDASDIDVEVKDGMATLSGSVPARWMKHLAEDLAERCSGVRDVDNRIRVRRDEGSTSAADTPASSGGGPTATTGASKSAPARKAKPAGGAAAETGTAPTGNDPGPDALGNGH
jgi:hypothetical protein